MTFSCDFYGFACRLVDNEIFSRPLAHKILKELLSNSEDFKGFQRISTPQVLGQPEHSKGFQLLKYLKEQRIPKDSKGFLRIPKDS